MTLLNTARSFEGVQEADVVSAAAAGSTDAFEALFRRYHHRVRGIVRSMVSGHAEVEDLIQDIFVAAFANLEAVENQAAFWPWLSRIARNACTDHLRRGVRSREVPLEAEDPRLSEQPGGDQGAYASVQGRERFRHLRQALEGLPPSQQDALVLREFLGLSYEEIGREMKLSRGAVESTLFRARRGVRDEYREISSGDRCRATRTVLVEMAEGMNTRSGERRAVRHLRGCDPCRREAVGLGLATLAAEARVRPLRRALDRAAAALPLPFLPWRRIAAEAGRPASMGVEAHGGLAHLGAMGPALESGSSLAHNAVAVVAATVAVIGGTAAIHQAGAGLPLPSVRTTVEAQAEREGAPDPGRAPGASGAIGPGGHGPGGHAAIPGGLILAAPGAGAPGGALVTAPGAPHSAAGEPTPAALAPVDVDPAAPPGPVGAEVPAAVVGEPVAAAPPAAAPQSQTGDGNGNGVGNGKAKGKGKNKAAAPAEPTSGDATTSPSPTGTTGESGPAAKTFSDLPPGLSGRETLPAGILKKLARRGG